MSDAIDVDEEATFFAMHLLMPTDLLKKELNKNPLDIDDEKGLKKLANKFKVSPMLMGQRIGMLKNESI